ncbi:hypothetical protein Hanom_Chr06g00548831 [Helianthus anomalus]
MRVFEIWTKMATKCKPQGPIFKKFEIWTEMTKLPKPQGPKWQFTLYILIIIEGITNCWLCVVHIILIMLTLANLIFIIAFIHMDPVKLYLHI